MGKSFLGLDCHLPVSWLCCLSYEGVVVAWGTYGTGAISFEVSLSSILICSFLLFGCHPIVHFPSPPSDSGRCQVFLWFPAKLLIDCCLVPFNWGHLPELSGRAPGEKRLLLRKQQCHCEGQREECKRVQVSLFLCFLLQRVEMGDQHKQNLFIHPWHPYLTE